MCVCACICVCAHYIHFAVTVSHINNIIFYIIKYKTYFKAKLISLDEAKFDNASEQFKFGAHAVHHIGCEIVQ